MLNDMFVADAVVRSYNRSAGNQNPAAQAQLDNMFADARQATTHQCPADSISSVTGARSE